jgi:hypothetical protein
VILVKKYLIGATVGVLLATTASVYADDFVPNLIGKTVEGTFKVKLNGNTVSKDAIVIDGSSYLPVRAAGEALGLNVNFKNNEVLLNSKNGGDGGGVIEAEITQRTYKECKAIEKNGITYFSPGDYERKFFKDGKKDGKTVWEFKNSDYTKLYIYGDNDAVNIIDLTDVENGIIFKGESYINIKYYPQ